MNSGLSPTILLLIIAAYFAVLMIIAHFTSKGGNNESFFTAKRQSPWLLVAVGMIGASLSGVTFISIPGVVGAGGKNMAFSYMQMVYGYLVGYFIIATVLLPLYYRLNLTTIYGYLDERFGRNAYKTGAAYFLLSRIIGASFRLFLVAIVMQKFIMDPFGVPFFVTVLLTIVLIWIYTFQGGIKTIVWTDTLQTVCMLGAVIFTIVSITNTLDLSISETISAIKNSEYGQMFYFSGGWQDDNNFFKQFISGALIALVMTGLDQDMMQKNLTCRTLGDAQKNVFVFSVILIFANLLFLGLGALLYIYSAQMGVEIPTRTDQLFPTIALEHLSPMIGVCFILGLIAAAYSSADSALTALTTSFCVDFLGFENDQNTQSEAEKKKQRIMVHIGFSVLLLLVINAFYLLDDESIVNQLFVAAGYTYGPILGLFSFGILTKYKVKDSLVIAVCIAAPILSFIINKYSAQLFGGFTFGFLILALNGFLTFVGLWLIAKKTT